MDYRVLVSTPVFSLNGVNVFAANLVRGLVARGIDASLLITDPDRRDAKQMPVPTDIPVDTLRNARGMSWKERLQTTKMKRWHARWGMMQDYLESHAPCIYLPNYDYSYSCISPRLPSDVGVVGIIHSDDPQHYEHVSRLAIYWDATVAVSQGIAEYAAKAFPDIAGRISVIPYGVRCAAHLPRRCSDPQRTLKIIYSGRLVQRQKRILDIPKIVRILASQGVKFEMDIVGSGSEHHRVAKDLMSFVHRGTIRLRGVLANDQVMALYEQADVFILTSEFEGMPVSLLEAMGCGCVPVVTDIRSGIPELIKNGENGFCVPVGDITGFANRISDLYQNPARRQTISAGAYNTVQAGGFGIGDMTNRYEQLFRRVLADARNGRFQRPSGPVLPPAFIRTPWRDRLTNSRLAGGLSRLSLSLRRQAK